MMDETEEEALFARLRAQLAARSPSGADAHVMARLETAIEARVEAAVARRVAGLRADLDHLAERLAGPHGRRLAGTQWRLATLVLASFLLAGGLAVWFGGDSLRAGVTGWRTTLLGQTK